MCANERIVSNPLVDDCLRVCIPDNDGGILGARYDTVSGRREYEIRDLPVMPRFIV